MDTLAKRLRHARKARGYTQDALAEAIGKMSRSVIFNIENNKNKTEPKTIVINKICEVLKISSDWLLQGTGEMDDTAKASRSAIILAELYTELGSLSEDELLYILDIVRAQKARLGNKN